MADAPNPCAGVFGAIYSFYMERPWLAHSIARLVWGIRTGPLYASFDAVAEVPSGATILDVPCGAGVTLRALSPEHDVRYIAADLEERMLERTRDNAKRRSLSQVEAVHADMCALPFENAIADLCLSYSGLHCVEDPALAVSESARCLKPGGRLVGSTFVAPGTRRQRFLFAQGRRQGHPMPTFDTDDLRGWLANAGIDGVDIEGDRGFVLFRGCKRRANVETSAAAV